MYINTKEIRMSVSQTTRWKIQKKILFPIWKIAKIKSISELCIKKRGEKKERKKKRFSLRKEGYVCSFNFQKWTCFRDYYATFLKQKYLFLSYRKMEAQKPELKKEKEKKNKLLSDP